MTKTSKKTPEGLKAIPGRRWVRAHYLPNGPGGEEVQLVDKEWWIATRVFEEGEVPGTAWVSLDRTIQVKQYEPYKVSMGCSFPTRREEAQEAAIAAIEALKEVFMAEMKEIQDRVKQYRGGGRDGY